MTQHAIVDIGEYRLFMMKAGQGIPLVILEAGAGVGGPRISHAFAKELGYDAGFGPGTTAAMVASYIEQEMVARSEQDKS